MTTKTGEPRTREALLAKIATYDGEALCPRCGNGFPVCADGPIDHWESCAKYDYGYDVCDVCEKALGWDRLPKPDPKYPVLEGDWETVRDALDALPEGAQIRWRTGMANRSELAIHRGHYWHSTNGPQPIESDNIARDETPIEVIA